MKRVPIPPSISTQLSARVAPVLRGDGVELVFLLQQVFRHRFQHRAAFNKGHRLQGFTTALNREAARLRHIQASLVTPKRRAGDGVMDSTGAAPAGLPGAG